MGFKFVEVVRSAPNRLQKSIQNKLFVVLFMLGFISLSLLGSIAVWLARNEVEREVLDRNRQVAALITDQIQGQFTAISNSLMIEARGSGLVNVPFQYVPLIYLKETASDLYQSLSLVDKDGKLLIKVEGKPGELRDRSFLVDPPQPIPNDPAVFVTKQGRTYFSTVNYRPDSNIPFMTFAIPVLGDDKVFAGTVIAEINLTRLSDLVKQVRIGQTVTVSIVDAGNRIVAHPDSKKIGTVLQPDKLREAIRQKEGTTQYREGDQNYLAGHATVANTSWGVVVAQDSDEAFAGISRLSMIAIAIIVGAIIIISFIAVALSKNITRGVRDLAVAANRITSTGNLDEQIPITSQDEVGELTASFNGMILALRKTRQALEHWNHELERKVDMRTRELTESNSRLGEINDQLERANLHKSQFLANMSHELRTPLNAIIGFSEVLQDQVFGELNDKQKRYVNNILSSGRHLLNLVNDVLDLSKVEAGKMELHWEEFSCRVIINDVKAQLMALASKKEIELVTDFNDNLNLVMADRGRFSQILYNLLSNAIKFTPQNGTITIKGKATNTGSVEKPAVAIFSVKDTGIGIPKEHLEAIFESFHQVDNSYSRQYQGTGLGLALTRKLIEMHGGRIWVESEVGTGSTFTFSLPLVTPCDDAADESTESAPLQESIILK